MKVLARLLLLAVLLTSVGITLFLHFAVIADTHRGASDDSGNAGSTGTGVANVGGDGGGASKGPLPRTAGGGRTRRQVGARAAVCADVRREVQSRFAGEPLVEGELACSDVTDTGRYASDCVDVTLMTLADDADTGAGGDGDGGDDADAAESVNYSGTLLNGRSFGAGKTDLLRLQLLGSGLVYGLDCRKAEFVFFNRLPATRESAGPVAGRARQSAPSPSSSSSSLSSASSKLVSAAAAGARGRARVDAVAVATGGQSTGGDVPLLASGQGHGGPKLSPRVSGGSGAVDSGRGRAINKKIAIAGGDASTAAGRSLPSRRVHAFYYPWCVRNNTRVVSGGGSRCDASGL